MASVSWVRKFFGSKSSGPISNKPRNSKSRLQLTQLEAREVPAYAVTANFTASNKTYDGTTAATIATRNLTGLMGTEVATLSGGTATFATPTVGTAKPVTATGFTLAGANASNYVVGTYAIDFPTYSFTNIATTGTRLVFTEDGESTSPTDYDDGIAKYTLGTNALRFNGVTYTGTNGGLFITTNGEVCFTNNFTTAVRPLYDYSNGDLSGRALDTVAVLWDDLVVPSSGSGGVFVQVINNQLIIQYNQVNSAFQTPGDPNSGTFQVIFDLNTGTTNGAMQLNYSSLNFGLPFNANPAIPAADNGCRATVGFAKANATTTANTASWQLFNYNTVLADGTTNAPMYYGTGLFSGRNLTGSRSYRFRSPGITTADITAKSITGSFTADNKTYDATTAATISARNLSGVVSGDTVTLTGGTATFSDKNVATGKTVTGTGFSITGASASNYTLASSTLTTTADITAKGLTANFTAANKTYDTTTSATILTRSLVGLIGSDAVTLTGGTATFDNQNVGNNKTVTATGFTLTGADSGNYAITTVNTATANISKALLTVGFTADNKTYDATTAATITSSTIISGVLGSDTVTISGGTATFNNKNVGTGKTVTATGFILGGAEGGNYSVGTVNPATADITSLAITGSYTVATRQYDGTTNATIATRSLSGVIQGDTVSLAGGTATFASKNVGTGIGVTGSGFTLSGIDAGNYTLTSVADPAGGDITPKLLTASFTAANKTYDTTTDATITSTSLPGVIGTEDVTLVTGTASFNNKNVGNNKTVTGTGFSISGTDSGNYSLAGVNTTTANITSATLVVSFSASNKTYDGTTAATITSRSIVGGVLGSDTVTVSGGTATFANKNVGTWLVTASGFTLGGADGGNYTVGTVNPTTADITAKALTGNFTAANKTYDTTDAATITGRSLVGVVGSEDVTLVGGTATFNNKNVGNGKTVTGTGFSISGTDSGNYTLASVNTTTANITAAPLTISMTAANKTYDGTTAATITSSSIVSGILGSDTVTISGGTATFNNKNVGTGKTVTGTGFTLGGADGGNYAVTAGNTTTADITSLAITGNFTAGNKTYDATTAATITGRSLNGAVQGDSVSLTGGTAAFADKNVGTGITVTGTGFSLSGTDAANYTLTSVGTTTANITAKGLTVNFTAANKTYDGTTAATITGSSLSGVIGTEDVTVSGGSAVFNNKNVGNGKPVIGSGFTLGGADAGNYSITSVPNASADITALSITGNFTAANKTYDGTTAATITGRSLNGTVSGDTVSLSGGTATFADKNVGTWTVTGTGFTLTGSDAGNYLLTSVGTTNASITAKGLTVNFTAANKTYDTTTAATITGISLSGVVGSENVTVTGGTASFVNQNVGNGKTVNGTGFGLGGSDAGNYTISGVNPATANITAAPLTIAITAANKTYDGTTAATITSSSIVSGILGSDTVTISGGTANFDNKNVGTGKTVTGTGFTLGGADGGNYAVTAGNTTTADITAKGLTLNFTAANKTYDSTTAATITGTSLTGVVTGDTVNVSGGSATFGDKNVGTGKTVTGTGFSLTGGDASNYTIASVPTTTANITTLGITGNFTASNKTYDGTTAATITGTSLTGVLSGDTVNMTGGSASFADKNVGTGKTVTGTGFSLSGSSASNYALISVGTTTADITARAITVTANSQTKTVGAPDPTLTYSVTSGSLASGDSFSGALTRQPGETAGVYAILQGTLTAGSNYNMTYVGANLTITSVSPPTVTGVTVNGGAAQRSVVKTISVAFSTAVNFSGPVANAFILSRVGGGNVGGFTATANIVNGVTVVTLTNFTGAETAFGSLANGLYNLTVLAAQVSNPGGQMAANYVLNGSTNNGLFRFFGDADGNGNCDGDDLAQFVPTLFNPANYNPVFDYNSDGQVDGDDLAPFVQGLFGSV